MESPFDRLVLDRLVADGHQDEAWAYLVLAALDGPAALEGALSGTTPPKPTVTPWDVDTADPVDPPGAYLSSIAVAGFRGIGARASLQLTPGPGLTLVVGRNGSGKSSFAEALELLLTGGNKRWDGRSSVWSDGWRNLHAPNPCAIDAEFAVEGLGSVTVSRTWADDAALDESTASFQVRGKPRRPYAELGWEAIIGTHRPFLPYNELGTLLEQRPSEAYQALANVLGMEELTGIYDCLQGARKNAQAAIDEVADRIADVVTKLDAAAASTDDERIAVCREALAARRPDITALARFLDGDVVVPADPVVAELRRFSATAPEAADVDRAADALTDAAARAEKAAATDAGRALALVRLLTEALSYHEAHAPADCPVCGAGGALGVDWRTQTEAQVEVLRGEAEAAEAADAALKAAIAHGRRLLAVPIRSVEDLAGLGLAGVDDAVLASRRWADGSALGDALALARHLRTEAPLLSAALVRLTEEVRTELARREDSWQPLAGELRTVVAAARAVDPLRERVKELKDAEKWFKGVQEDVRNERFRPIADRAVAIWGRLRQNSNVRLDSVALAGIRTQRRVSLDVSVDGVAGAALGVMSQGELNALALSLFMPRAALPESPFRFMVIDDPVQSMDPSRVDGLARALEETAARRQVIVFTHDDRLPESVRRLGIAAAVIEVTRRPGSLVEPRSARTPVQGYIEDAFAICLASSLPPDVRKRVVPGFCRSAIEAACVETVRARRLKKGVPHGDVERLLTGQRTLTKLMALALFDDEERGADVLRTLRNKVGPWSPDVFQAVNKGSHEAHAGSLEDLARDAEHLAKRVRALP